ncbi:MAG: helix-turn-helix domain-containing protein [Coriobacteriia bacterium]|nr:helix-turn-helix domain-containing protein [Coriobacteriia bacterium]
MPNTIGNTLRALRGARNETLAEVSRATGISPAMLSRIERGERSPSPAAVRSLARHFGLPAHELLGETLAERMCARYGRETAAWAAVLLVERRPGTTAEPSSRRSSPDPGPDRIERAVSDYLRILEWADREAALQACTALWRLAEAPLRALRDVRERHPDPAVRSAAAALLSRLGSA